MVTDLVNAHHDAHGNTVYGLPVINKPWEWTEHIGEPSLDLKEEDRDREEKDRYNLKNLVKNSGSISLDHFAARLTGDVIKEDMLNVGEGQMEGCLRSFEDGMSESLFARDWRETRRGPQSTSETFGHSRAEYDVEMLLPSDTGKMQQGSRASPASSTVSRSSTQGTGSSLRQKQSPSQTIHSRASTVHEVIDVDSMATGSSSAKGKDSMKRKTAPVSDDEIEIIEGPVASRSGQTAKKQKAAKAPAATKTRARKK